MTIQRLLGATAVVALLSHAALAQSPAAPAETPRPATVAPTPPIAPPPNPATATPPVAAPATPPVAAPAPDPATAPMTGQLVAHGDIVETLKADGHFNTLVKALETANMTGVLKTNRNLTVFAPTDAAFAALPPGELDRLMKHPAELQKLLTYHVINATVESDKIRGAKGEVKTVAGSRLMLDGSGAGLKANTASIVQVDVKAANGTVHVVDSVLMPTTASPQAAAMGGASDAAATAPAPAVASPPAASMPATPPKADPAPPEPATPVPETPPTAEDPARPKG